MIPDQPLNTSIWARVSGYLPRDRKTLILGAAFLLLVLSLWVFFSTINSSVWENMTEEEIDAYLKRHPMSPATQGQVSPGE